MNADYNLLPLNEKANLLWNQGDFIDGIELNDYDVYLYKFEDQLVELFYSIHDNRVVKVSFLQDMERLKLYDLGSEKELELV
jgi:hypothetical protein